MANARRKLKRVLRKQKVSTDEASRLLPWYKAVPELEHRAFAARDRAVSYKGFHVGLAALVAKSDGSIAVVEGANRKEAEGPRKPTDHCAEEEMLEQLDAMPGAELLGFVCVAPHQPDDLSGYDLGVTICCGHCRSKLRTCSAKPDHAVKPRTRVLFINADNRSKRVELRLDAVLELCRSRDRSALAVSSNGNGS